MTIPKEITEDLRSGLSLEETLIKHNTNLKILFNNIEHENIKKKNVLYNSDWRNIKPTRSSTYGISKQVNGIRLSFGTYKTFEDAKLVRDELERVCWDKEKLPEILSKHNIVMRRKGGWQD